MSLLTSINSVGVCIKNGQCLCLPGYKSEHCASRIAKFYPFVRLSGTYLSLIDIYILLSLVSSTTARLLNFGKYFGKSQVYNYGLNLILNHFKGPNIIHYIYSLFLFHKFAPELYSLIGSRNIGYLIAICHCLRFANSWSPVVMFSFESSSVLSLINLTSLIILNQLKSGHTAHLAADKLSEYIRYISLDVLLSLNLSSFWIGIEAIICATILLKLMF